jgi:hypothetical protein
MAITCPCSGFAYGQSGKLSLIRLRGGREVERMDLGPLFVSSDLPEKEGVEGQAVLARWPVADGAAKRASQGDPKLVAEIERRPAPVVMRLGDYDRGGQATEFLIEVGTLPCGKLQFAAVEVSAKQPRLHVLSSIDQPDTPLVMPLSAWQALQQRPGPSTVHTWDCGDHGSETSTELVVAARDGQIRVEERESACSP